MQLVDEDYVLVQIGLPPKPYKLFVDPLGSFTYLFKTEESTSKLPGEQDKPYEFSNFLGKFKGVWKNDFFYLTEDIAIFRYRHLYMAMGAGAGLQAKENKRLGTKLLFQFKVTFGYNFNRRWASELFIQHFSNANTADENNSYAFYGLGLTYNF